MLQGVSMVIVLLGRLGLVSGSCSTCVGLSLLAHLCLLFPVKAPEYAWIASDSHDGEYFKFLL